MESEHGTSLQEIGNFTSSAGADPLQASRQQKSDAATKPKPVITGATAKLKVSRSSPKDTTTNLRAS